MSRRADLAACLRCGGTDWAPLTLADGLWAEGGESYKWVCRACAWQGTPIVFDDDAALVAFRSGLQADGG